MLVKTKLLPGENGTKGLLKQYGEQLVCVRYRYDKASRKRYKTVELIIDEKDWLPGTCIPATRRVYIRIGYGETELRELVKQAGGYWSPDKKAWHLEYRSAIRLGLETRIIDPEINL
ncbi:MAG: hypothetical protein ABFS24_09465 [Pseudomonadota bacterium]